MKRGYHPPLTVTRRALLKGGSDVEFRRLIYRLLLVEERLRRARDFLGKRAGLTGPQYTMLITVAYLQGATGISVQSLARNLRVTSGLTCLTCGVRRFGGSGETLGVPPAARLETAAARTTSRATAIGNSTRFSSTGRSLQEVAIRGSPPGETSRGRHGAVRRGLGLTLPLSGSLRRPNLCPVRQLRAVLHDGDREPAW